MFPMVTEFMNYGQQTVRAARYIGQGFMITLSHPNRLPVTIQRIKITVNATINVIIPSILSIIHVNFL